MALLIGQQREDPTEMTTTSRLSVNINEESAETLRHVTRSRGITTTEAIRRAVGLLAFFEDARENHTDVLTKDADGNFEKVVAL